MCFPRHPDTQSFFHTAQESGETCPDGFMEVAPFPAPALLGADGPKPHLQLAHASLLPGMEAWQQQQQQQQPLHPLQSLQQPACFVPTAVASSTAGANSLLACQQGWQLMAGQGLPNSQYQEFPASLQREEDEQQQQQQALDEEGAAGAGLKGRLRWSAQLHAQFVAAVDQLGGAFTATPKRILAIMAVTGLTLFHVKSHLQKYRNALAGGGSGSKRRCMGHARKRSAANMRAPPACGGGSAGGSGSSSDAEAEAEAGQLRLARHQHTTGTNADGSSNAQRSCKRASSVLPPPLLSVQAALGGSGAAAHGAGSAFASECLLLPGWGSEPDLEGIDEELAAVLAPAGSLSDSEQLLDLQPASLEQLDQELSQELACCGLPQPPAAAAAPPAPSASPSAEARPPPAAASAAAAPAAATADEDSSGTATRAHSAGGDSTGGGQSSIQQHQQHHHQQQQQQQHSGMLPEATAAAAAAAAAAMSPSAPALPAVPAVVAALPRAPSPAIGSEEHGLLQAALKIQVEMQRQLSQTIEAQQQLQKHLESHGKYIQSLLRSEGGPLPSKPAAAGRAGSKGRGSGGPASTKTRRVTAVAAPTYQRSASLQASPFAPQAVHQPPMGRSGSAPQLVELAAAGPLKSPLPQLSTPLLPSIVGHAPAPPGPPGGTQLVVAAALVQPGQPSEPGQLHQQVGAAAAAQAAAAAALPSRQMEQRFRQQQEELERQLEQQRRELEQQAQQRRMLLEQQQQQEHAAAVTAAAAAALPAKHSGVLQLAGLMPSCGPGMGSSAPAALLQLSGGADGSTALAQPQPQPSCQPCPGWASVTGSPALQPGGSAHPLPSPPALHPAGSHASCATLACPAAAGAAAAGVHPSLGGGTRSPEPAGPAASAGSAGEQPLQGGDAPALPAKEQQDQQQQDQQQQQQEQEQEEEQRQPGLIPPLDSGLFDADMWDSLLVETGVLHQLLDADS